MDELQTMAAIAGDIGVWAIFAYLYLDERKRHTACREAHRDDLRTFAGMSVHVERPSQLDGADGLTDAS